MTTEFTNRIFQLSQEESSRVALDVFHFQYQYNHVYKSYIDILGSLPQNVKTISQIPFLPVSFFKTHRVQAGSFEPEAIFESSGTSQTINSRHYIKDLSIYRRSFTAAFEKFYGPVNEWCIIGLLPSYLERKQSSLVVMVDELIKMSCHANSGFYLYEYEKLYEVLHQSEKDQQKTLLIGVTFALLDFAEKFSMKLEHTVIIETGGMKGRRTEMTRPEVHQLLKDQLGLHAVHSEYGMTELLSQAYSKNNGIFECVPWMKVLVRNEDDPFDLHEQGAGIINIIDLANIYSCSFIATDDVGKVFANGTFEVLGRLDNSDIRGCSLLVV